MRTASCTSLSVNVGIPSGRILSEFFFCIYVRLTGVGLNLPFFSCSVIFCIFLSLKLSAVSSFTPFVDAPLFAYRFLYASNHISSRNKYLNRRVNTSSLLFNEFLLILVKISVVGCISAIEVFLPNFLHF